VPDQQSMEHDQHLSMGAPRWTGSVVQREVSTTRYPGCGEWKMIEYDDRRRVYVVCSKQCAIEKR
jgi:hypothetical protein